MREDEVSRGDVFFKKTLLLMSSFLILLFIVYEFLESPSRDFISIKIVNCEEDQYGVHITLSISNNSSRKSEGVLLIMLGYKDSIIFENNTFYSFTGFKVFNHSALPLSPGEKKTLKIDLALSTGVKRILAVYCLNSSSPIVENNHDQVVIKKSEILWVQTWIS